MKRHQHMSDYELEVATAAASITRRLSEYVDSTGQLDSTRLDRIAGGAR